MNQNDSTGNIVFEINENFENGYDNSNTWWDMYAENELEFCPVRNGQNNHQFEVQSDTIEVRGAEWYILGQLKDEDGLYVDCYNWDNFAYCEVYTLVLSLACAGCPDGKEFDVSGQMIVRAKSNGKNAKVFKFARTFTSTKTEFLGDFMEINVFEDLKLKKDDRVIVEVAFSVEQRDVKKCSKEDLVMLKVNENYMEVDKFVLAFHSEYFKTLFFGGNRFPATEHKIALPESTTVEDFKQLVEILEEKSTLNDDSIQGTFILTNFFGFPKLEASCRKFLIEDSDKGIIFKYKLVDTCGLTILRDNILASMTLKDVDNEKTFMDECEQLGESAFAAFDARLKELKIQGEKELSGNNEYHDDDDDDDYQSEESEQWDLDDEDDDDNVSLQSGHLDLDEEDEADFFL